ncbi:MAG: peptidase S58 [Candidatus Thermofonsia Clade 1 bacterium]|uniref:Peptidase S58 n=1 Tax=Candidatus Thermofonsia Clade 1 bacterium TaxID=2364210 RepID=A0A2M8PI50_9CHLR|nr:MAG: peptidase S58 [Candidatus Thermofonsia Clade 1 bacterium]
MLTNETLTAVQGIQVGHATDREAITGCTVILCPPQTLGSVDQRGSAPGTRETDLLHPDKLVQHVNAIVLAGGSAYGLAAVDGVMRYLEERGVGYPTAAGVVPIVPAAILFDLDIGRAERRPDAAMGYAACQAASTAPVLQGSVGAGTGAVVNRMMGLKNATKGGIGSAALQLGNGLIVAALIAVNALGDVVDEEGRIIAGAHQDGKFVGALNLLQLHNSVPPTNTLIGVVATNARLSKADLKTVAAAAHDGIAQAIRPAHTPFDGDTIFSLATGQVEANLLTVNAFAAQVTATAIRNAVRQAESLGGVPALRDLL